ncbi:MAG TPA: hypothetical protein VGJ95_11465 [Pseudonocardiaceae bacterium]
MICRTCLDAVDRLVDLFADSDLDDPAAPDPTSEESYASALRDERIVHTDGLGRSDPATVRRGDTLAGQPCSPWLTNYA